MVRQLSKRVLCLQYLEAGEMQLYLAEGGIFFFFECLNLNLTVGKPVQAKGGGVGGGRGRVGGSPQKDVKQRCYL